ERDNALSGRRPRRAPRVRHGPGRRLPLLTLVAERDLVPLVLVRHGHRTAAIRDLGKRSGSAPPPQWLRFRPAPMAKGWRITDVKRPEHGIVAELAPSRSTAICSGCGETKTRIHDLKPAREWRHLDGWGVPTFVRCVLRRVRCRHCGVRV